MKKKIKITEKDYLEVIRLLKNITAWSSYEEHPIGIQAKKVLTILKNIDKINPSGGG